MTEKIKLLEAMDVYLPDVDGVINAMHNYCLNLNDKTELSVMVPKNKKGYVDKLPYKVERCKSVFIPVLNSYYGFPDNDTTFKKNIMNGDYDIIHVHSPYNMAKFALTVAKKKKIPIVATYHSNMKAIFEDVTKSESLAENMNKTLGKLYNKFDEVFVCSPLVEQQLRETGYKGPITQLPFGTDFEQCSCVDEYKEKANKIFNFDSDEIVFIYVGRIMKLKRIDFILDSLKLVKSRGKKFKFYVVGKGPELQKLKKYAKKLGFTDNEVVFTGFLPREQFPLIFARADLLLFPSLYDNFGLVKVEGASYQTPGLYIKDSCAGYGVKDGVNGYLSQNSVFCFASKICEIIENKEQLKQAGINASKDLYISWKDCSDVLLNRLNNIVKEHKIQLEKQAKLREEKHKKLKTKSLKVKEPELKTKKIVKEKKIKNKSKLKPIKTKLKKSKLIDE